MFAFKKTNFALIVTVLLCFSCNSQKDPGTTTVVTAEPKATSTQTFDPAQATLAVSAGGSDNFTCGIVNGAAKCWGKSYNDSELGVGARIRSTVPLNVFGLDSGVEAIEAGFYNVCAIVRGEVQCWGSQWEGELGVPFGSVWTIPIAVSGLPKEAKAITVGDEFSCAIVGASRDAWCWGRNNVGQLGNGTNVDTGDNFGNWHGVSRVLNKIGTDQDGNPFTAPLSHVVAISAGRNHVCAIIGDAGELWCWGNNGNGQLGNGTNTNSTLPVQVLKQTGVDGDGNPITAPLIGATSLSLGSDHSCALVGDQKQAWCWGQNNFGQLGNGTADASSLPVQVLKQTGVDGDGNPITAPLIGATSLSLGSEHSCALIGDQKEAWCWGNNNDGQLGNGGQVSRILAAQVMKDANHPFINIESISSGEHHTCATSDSSIYCWGASGHTGGLASSGLGDGTTENRLFPVPVLGISTLSTLAFNAASKDIVSGESSLGNSFMAFVTGGVAPYTFEIISSLSDPGSFTLKEISQNVFIYKGPIYNSVTGSAIIRVRDANGSVANLPITVHGSLTVSPENTTIAARSSGVFQISGGIPPYVVTVPNGTLAYGIFHDYQIFGYWPGNMGFAHVSQDPANTSLVTYYVDASSTSMDRYYDPWGMVVGLGGASGFQIADSVGNTASISVTHELAPLAVFASNGTSIGGATFDATIGDSVVIDLSGGVAPYHFTMVDDTAEHIVSDPIVPNRFIYTLDAMPAGGVSGFTVIDYTSGDSVIVHITPHSP